MGNTHIKYQKDINVFSVFTGMYRSKGIRPFRYLRFVRVLDIIDKTNDVFGILLEFCVRNICYL